MGVRNSGIPVRRESLARRKVEVPVSDEFKCNQPRTAKICRPLSDLPLSVNGEKMALETYKYGKGPQTKMLLQGVGTINADVYLRKNIPVGEKSAASMTSFLKLPVLTYNIPTSADSLLALQPLILEQLKRWTRRNFSWSKSTHYFLEEGTMADSVQKGS